MNARLKKLNQRHAYTIIELLTVMSIIVILIGLLVPAMNKVRIYASKVQQKAQFHSIEVAMELFEAEHEGKPNSDAQDIDSANYCGAMKLCEAMMGQDLLGFHPESVFRESGLNINGDDLYPPAGTITPAERRMNLKARKGPYLPLDNANAYPIQDLYSNYATYYDVNDFVLCDVYKRVTNRRTGKKVGMPILYYKADTTKDGHDVSVGGYLSTDNIYSYLDNDQLVLLGMPWASTLVHPMASTGFPGPDIFYEKTWNRKVTTMNRPYKADSYILLSAGYDGEYGTADDIFNFGN